MVALTSGLSREAMSCNGYEPPKVGELWSDHWEDQWSLCHLFNLSQYLLWRAGHFGCNTSKELVAAH